MEKVEFQWKFPLPQEDQVDDQLLLKLTMLQQLVVETYWNLSEDEYKKEFRSNIG